MHDACRMCSGKRGRNLAGNLQRVDQLQGALRDPLAQRVTFDIFGDDEVKVVVLSDLIDCENVRVAESGGRASFLLKPPDSSSFLCEVTRQQLERDLTA